MIVSFKLNGKYVKVEVLPNERLSNVLRSKFGLKSIKIASYDGLRGGDCILLDGNVAPSSLIPIFNVEGRELVSLEYFSSDKSYAPYYKLIMKHFKMHNIELCGFCNAGKIFATYKIIKVNLDSDDAYFDEKLKTFYSISLCRCTVPNKLISCAKEIIASSMRSKRAINYGRK